MAEELFEGKRILEFEYNSVNEALRKSAQLPVAYEGGNARIGLNALSDYVGDLISSALSGYAEAEDLEALETRVSSCEHNIEQILNNMGYDDTELRELIAQETDDRQTADSGLQTQINEAGTRMDGIDARIDRVESLGDIVGTFDTYAILNSKTTNDFPNGIMKGDYAYVRADEEHNGVVVCRSVLNINGTAITWDSGIPLGTDITGKADDSGTLEAGSGAGTDTPRTTSTVWGFLQNIWNRIFAIVTKIGNVDRAWTDTEINTSTARSGGSLARRSPAGYLAALYFNQQSNNNENPQISQFFVQNSNDNYLRKASLTHVIASLLRGDKTGLSATDIANFAPPSGNLNDAWYTTNVYIGNISVGSNFPPGFAVGQWHFMINMPHRYGVASDGASYGVQIVFGPSMTSSNSYQGIWVRTRVNSPTNTNPTITWGTWYKVGTNFNGNANQVILGDGNLQTLDNHTINQPPAITTNSVVKRDNNGDIGCYRLYSSQVVGGAQMDDEASIPFFNPDGYLRKATRATFLSKVVDINTLLYKPTLTLTATSGNNVDNVKMNVVKVGTGLYLAVIDGYFNRTTTIPNGTFPGALNTTFANLPDGYTFIRQFRASASAKLSITNPIPDSTYNSYPPQCFVYTSVGRGLNCQIASSCMASNASNYATVTFQLTAYLNGPA